MQTKPGYSFVTWFTWNEVAIAAGFLFPSWMLVNAIISGWDPAWQFLIVVVGGAIQGFLTGFVQWALFARTGVVPPLLAWLAFMAGGTAIAWVVAQVPGFLPAETDAAIRLPLVTAGIALALGVPMFAQWWVLRSVSQGAWKYSLISYLGWLVGSAIMGGVLLVLSGVTDIKITVALLVVGALAAVMCASAGTWLGAAVMSGQTIRRRSTGARSSKTRSTRTRSTKSRSTKSR